MRRLWDDSKIEAVLGMSANFFCLTNKVNSSIVPKVSFAIIAVLPYFRHIYYFSTVDGIGSNDIAQSGECIAAISRRRLL